MTDSEQTTAANGMGANGEVAAWFASRTARRAGLVLFLIVLLASRACQLGSKPLHHDESLFGYYGYLLATTGYYDYDPILHGPLLIELTAGCFRVFGNSDTTLRLVSVFCGLLLFPLLWLLRPWLGRRGTALALLLVLVSPNLCYYSRFLRNDALFLMLTLLNLVAIAWALRSEQIWPLVLWPVSFALMVSTKENVVFVAASQIGFAVLWIALDQRRIARHHRGERDPYPTGRARFLHGLIMANISLVVWVLVAWTYVACVRPRIPLGPWAVPLWGIGVVTTAALLDAFWRAVRYNRDGVGLAFRLYERLYCDRHWWVAGFALAVVTLAFCYSICMTQPQPLVGLMPWVSADAWSGANTDSLDGPFHLLGLFRWAVAYWWGEHATERLGGPFHCYAAQIILYELPAVLIVVTALLRDWLRNPRRRVVEVGLWLVAGCVIWTTTFIRPTLSPDQLPVVILSALPGTVYERVSHHLAECWSYLHLDSMADLFWAATVAYWGLIWAARSIFEGRPLRGWLIFWVFTSYLFYGYAGEKVPWLALHILLPLLLLAAALWQEWTDSCSDARRRGFVTALVAALLAWNAWQTFVLCFAHPTNPAELAIFNHTREPARRVARELERGIKQGSLKTGRRSSDPITRITDPSNVVIQGEAQWPMIWYLRRYADARYEPDEYRPRLHDEIVITDPPMEEKSAMLREDFKKEIFELRTAWIPPTIDAAETLGLRRLAGEPDGLMDKLRYRWDNSADILQALGRYVLLREAYMQLPSLAAGAYPATWTQDGDHPTTINLVDENNEPIARATVELIDATDNVSDATSISDRQGRAIATLDEGRYVVWISDFQQRVWATPETLVVSGPTSLTCVGRRRRGLPFAPVTAVFWKRVRPSPSPLQLPPFWDTPDASTESLPLAPIRRSQDRPPIIEEGGSPIWDR